MWHLSHQTESLLF